MSGWKTVLMGAIIAVVPALTQYSGTIDWSFLGPTGGMIASGVIMIALRWVTTTPIFTGK